MPFFTDCPLCGGMMQSESGRMICTENPNHILSIEKELNRYHSGEKDVEWLRSRMKVRLGKLVHHR
jgi:hypothetical protein